MKQNKVFLGFIILLISSCTSPLKNVNNIIGSPTPTQNISPSRVVMPTLTTSPSPKPTVITTSTPDIVVLRTPAVNEPSIIATLGTKIPPGWYRQRVLFSPDGRFLVSSYGNKISLWEVGSYKKLSDFLFLDEHYGVDKFAFSSDGRFVATTAIYWDDPKSHLFVWDTANMELKLSMDLDLAILEKDLDYPYHYPATAIAFVPNSMKLVTANGNSIQIINLEDKTEPITIDLGQDMYASNISFPSDGRFIYVFMEWWKDNGFRLYPRYQTKYVVQIWDTNTHFLWRTLNFPELGWGDEPKHLQGTYLVTTNPEKGTNEMASLENEVVQKLPYRQGWSYITTDDKYILFSRYFGVYPYEERGLELWTTDSWRMLYKFRPDFYDYPDRQSPLGSDRGEIAISNDNKYLAVAYAGQIFIYAIRILTTP